jgi:electron transfer flavoprotein alpha subunit
MKMAGNIWVFAEQWHGQLSKAAYEALALGRELADELGVKLEAVLLGHDAQDLAQTMGVADTVLYVDHPTLREPTPEVYTHALAQLIQTRHPSYLIISLTNVGMDLGPLLAAQLDIPFVNFCQDVRIVEGQVQPLCLLYGGKIQATVAMAGEPAIMAILPGTRPAEEGRADRVSPVERLEVSLPETPVVRFKGYVDPEASGVDITMQEVLVAVGRGIQTQENVELAQELANELGGAICGSRPVIDQGWLPLSAQVGRSGATVKPKLYIAAGISGAPEHVEGMKDSALIVAINTDAQAPIFNLAHYGIVADALDILPALTIAARAGKEAKSYA